MNEAYPNDRDMQEYHEGHVLHSLFVAARDLAAIGYSKEQLMAEIDRALAPEVVGEEPEGDPFGSGKAA